MRRSSFSAEPDVPITRAPSSFPTCTAATPTPDETPVTSSHSPARNRPCAISMSCTTMNTSGMAAASSQESRAGTGTASRASMSAYSAKPPAQRPITRSPGARLVTPAPTRSTSPAHSAPPGFASVAGLPGVAWMPWRTMSSPRLSDAA